MSLALLGLLLAILAGVAGTAVGSANFGIVFVWIVWFGLLMAVLLPLGGRLWCLLCPIPAPGEWLQRRAFVAPPGSEPSAAPRRRWPRRLRGIWLQNLGFLGVALLSTVTLTQPAVSGWLLLAFVMAATGLSLVFERRAFCRYLCPVGGFIGLYALLSPLEVRVRDREVCRGHETKDCYVGNAHAYGCPWLERPWQMERNAYCGLCAECFRACKHDNLQLALRAPGWDLAVASGWRLDEAAKALIMLACAVLYPLVLLGPWGWLKDGANLGSAAGFGAYAVLFLGINVLLVPGIHLAVTWSVRMVGGLQHVPWSRLFAALAYPLVPLGLAAWVAFTVSFVFANGSYALSVLSDPFGWGWNVFGTRDIGWHPVLAGWVPGVQATLVILGLVGAVATADSVLGRLAKGAGARSGTVMMAAALTAQALAFLWIYLGAAG